MFPFALLTAAAGAEPIAYADGPGIPWLRIVLAFALCIALAIGAIGFIRVKNGMPLIPDEMRSRTGASGEVASPGNDERIRIAQRLSVTPQSQLVVVTRGRQNYLLHLTNNGATEIDRFHDDRPDTPS